MSKLTIVWTGEAYEIEDLLEALGVDITEDLPEVPEIDESVLSVEPDAEARNWGLKTAKPKLSAEQKSQILDLGNQGKSVEKIKSATGITDGRQIKGVLRFGEKRSKPDDLSTQTEEKVARLESTVWSRRDVDEFIWKTFKDGETDLEKISEELCAKGIYLSSAVVRRRLLQQGANL